MSDLGQRIAGLSPEKRALLTLRLKKKRAEAASKQAILRRDDLSTYPLSFAQQRLWFLDQLEPGSSFYNIPAAVRLAGSLDAAVLEQSLNEVVRRHEVLRATFVMVKGQPVQVIAPELTLSLPVISLQHLPEVEREAEVLRLATEEARRSFDLTQRPLVRASLLKLSAEEHVILLTMHHIVYDGWSTDVLVRELAALYSAFSNGRSSPLPEMPIQYADYAHWQHQWLRGEVLESQLAYWKQQLSDSPPALELPTDRSRPPFQTYRGAHCSFELPRSLHDKLKALSQREEVTLFMTMLAAFQTLLYRYTGQADVSVGTPIANRTRVKMENLIGFFVNTLVLRTDLSGEPTFLNLLKRIREVTLEAYAHQDLPFEMLVEALQPERDMSRTPLFQVMFDLQKVSLEALHLGGMKLNLLRVETGIAKFDLMLMMEEGADGLKGALEYNTDLFDAATVRRMAGHFQTLLEGIVADPAQTITTLPLLPEAERRQLLVEWNETAVEYPQDQCFHQRFEAQVERTPEAIAVVFEGEQLTYQELNRRANQVAHYLRRRGVGPEVVVGYCAERSLELVVGVMGILKAGGAYLPLDPTYPKERLAFMLEDARVPVLLTQERLLAGLPTEGAEVVCLDADWEDIVQDSDENLDSGVEPENLAYIIYTSGSTGRPKGVMVQHRSALHLATALHRIIYASHPGTQLRLSLNAPLPFDASVQQLVMLLYGHALYVIPQEVRQDGEMLLTYLRHNRLDLLDCVPSQLKLLLAEGLLDGSGWVPSVVLPGGEAIDEATWQMLAEAERTEFYNMYGPTECTVDSTIGRVKMAAEQPTIGRPVSNARLYVLDQHLQPVPIGIPGELHIGGDGVGRGYLDRPELTAERFIPNPFDDEPGSRLYKTGDLVRYLPDGSVEFLGRIDHQVKVRGFRIELGEIEAVLQEHPDVRNAVALVREDTPGDPSSSLRLPFGYAQDRRSGQALRTGKRLVGYVVPEDGASPTVSALRRFLKDRLPEYMVPSVFVTLEALPLTPNGKVDRRALPIPDQARPDLEETYVAPRTPVEELLADIWMRVLGVEQVGVQDNFFDLGGHSLLATQLISRVRDDFQVELPLRALFEWPTVAGLSEQVEVARRAAAGLSAPPIEPVLRDGRLPLSFAQRRLWFLDQLEPGSPFYNISDAVRISGRLDVAALEQSLNEIVRRHEVLRTVFPTVDGKPVQVIAPELILALPVADLTGLPEAEQDEEALRRARAEAQRPFDLGRGPLLRVTLLRLGEENHVVLLTMHHIVSDGWSTGVLVREIAALYDAFSHDRSSPLPEIPVQYADFARWQREWLRGEVLERQLAYWKEQLAGLPPLLELPTDRPRPAAQTFQGALQWFEFPRDLSKAIKDLCQQEGVTLFMTLLAAFQTLLYRYTGQEDISVGTPIANRSWSELEGLIGFFVNTLVMRTDLSGEQPFRELLKQVREVAMGAYAHQDLPFETLVDAMQPERDLSHSPLFQVMFVLQNGPMEFLELPGLTLTSLEVDGGTAKFDLALSMLEKEDKLQGALEYNTDLFDGATIQRMLGHFQRLLEEILADPDRPISTLPLLTEAGRGQLLVEWNSTEADYPQDRCAHQLFEVQVARTPEATAVTFEGETLTYRELNRRVNQLAHYLQKRGVGPETLVGICVDRSLEMVVGLLGVLKAGGAYVPMDPAYPPERLAFMLEDAHVPVMLTQARLVASLPTEGAEVVRLDADWETIAREDAENPVSDVTPENTAYVIYTSGSTGKPKGTLLEHRGLCNLATVYIQDFDVGPGSRVLQFFSFSFDGSVADIFMALLSGATLCLAHREDLLPGPGLNQLLHKQAVTTAVMTPSALAVLPADGLPALQTLVSGGESCTREIVTRWARDRRFFNAYGPTEATVASSWYRVDSPSEETTNIPIGRPIANYRLYILDRHLQPVPVGVPGELYIGGGGMARGYLNRPALTAGRFIPDPFSDDPGARFYKTGDLARYRPDGNIEFLGRIDHQVKVRGFRIELGEIETLLGGHPALREVIVLARGDTPGDKRLVAYVVPEDDLTPSVSELRGFLKERLPEYMVPSAFVTLEALPLTPVGKVDRRALPAPDQTRPDLEAAYVSPRTPAEETLADIWAQVLGVERVGVYDNFFELGGDSILSIQVIARANQAGLRLSPRQLFQHPTVAGLAAVAGQGPAVQAEQGMVEGPVALTPIQRWFFEQGLSELHHWNQAFLLGVRERLDPALLERAVETLLAHHDALRLRFTPSPSPPESGEAGWEQVNAGLNGETPFDLVDLSALPAAKQGPAVEARAAALQASLSLEEGPLVRVAYFNLGQERPGYLLMVVHHLAVDGVSWRILLEDLQATYERLRRGEAVVLPPKTTSFQHWAQRLVEYAQSEDVREDLAYWLAVGNGTVVPLPADYPGGENTEATARSVMVGLSEKETQALLQEVPVAYGTEINEILLTALVEAFAQWTGRRALLVDLEGHGREDLFEEVDLSRTVGWFTTTYPVWLDLERTRGPGEALKAVKEQLRAVPRRGIGYGLLRYLSEDGDVVKRLRASSPARVSFNYLGQFDQVLGEASLFGPALESPGPSRSLRERRPHLLSINGGVVEGQLQMEWTYSKAVHRREMVEQVAEDFIEALRAIIAHCQSLETAGYTPSDFPDVELDQDEIESLMVEIGEAI